MSTKTHMPLPLEKWAEYPRLRPRKKLLVGMELREEDLARYWRNVKKLGPNDCWEWIGYFAAQYGQFGFMHSYIKAHRMALYLVGIEIPNGMCACHSCDNPKCVNPSHLWVGSNADNVADRQAKGRTRTGTARGERHWQSKLTRSQVEAILKDERLHADIAKTYQVSRSNITMIKTGKAWPEVDRSIIHTLQES